MPRHSRMASRLKAQYMVLGRGCVPQFDHLVKGRTDFDPVNTVIIVVAARAARKFTREAGRAAREGSRAVGRPTGERKAEEEARQPASSATRTSMENPTRTSLENPLSLSQFPLDVVNFWQQVNSWEKLTISSHEQRPRMRPDDLGRSKKAV